MNEKDEIGILKSEAPIESTEIKHLEEEAKEENEKEEVHQETEEEKPKSPDSDLLIPSQ